MSTEHSAQDSGTSTAERAPESEESEPAILGAAATLPAERQRRRRRSRRRQDRRSPASSTAETEVGAPLPEGYSGTEYVFEPHTSAMPHIPTYLRNLWERRGFIAEMARAEIRGKRSNKVLGRVWDIMDPLVQAGIYYLLFTIIREGSRPLDFLHILVGGMFLFQLATSALNEGGNSIRKSKNLMLNSAFPRASLPITTVYSGTLKFFPAIGVYIGFHIAMDAPVHSGLLLLPVLFLLQVLFMVGMALFSATLVVFFQDAQNLLRYVTRLLFFTSPVIYPLSVMPDEIRSVLQWQPFFPFFASYQMVLGGGTPTTAIFLQMILWTTVFVVVGGWLFLRHEREFALKL